MNTEFLITTVVVIGLTIYCIVKFRRWAKNRCLTAFVADQATLRPYELGVDSLRWLNILASYRVNSRALYDKINTAYLRNVALQLTDLEYVSLTKMLTTSKESSIVHSYSKSCEAVLTSLRGARGESLIGVE